MNIPICNIVNYISDDEMIAGCTDRIGNGWINDNEWDENYNINLHNYQPNKNKKGTVKIQFLWQILKSERHVLFNLRIVKTKNNRDSF